MFIGNNTGSVGYFPKQKLPDSKKNKDWYKDCINSAMSLAIFDQGESKHKMNVYTDLDNDIIDESEIEKVFNPLNIEYAAFPASLKNYPLTIPKLDLLQGEELKRKFEYVVKAQNESAYSSAQSDLQEMLMEIMIDELTKEATDDQQIEQRIQKFSKYSKYEWKDTNEITGTRILEYLWREQDLQDKFNKSFRDALVKGQEIFRIDVVGNEPVVVKTDPRKVFSLRRGDSEKIEDSDIIVEISYNPLGAVIDEFYEHLTNTEIDDLESGRSNTLNPSGNLNYRHKYPPIYSNIDPGDRGEGFRPLEDFNSEYDLFALPYDEQGNVRVVRVRWKGRRKIGRLTYFDENTGDEQTKLVPEGYEINKDLGETVKWLWINEAYEGTLVGDEKYIKTQPREIQMRHFDNISKCFLGYVGTDYGKSLMSRMEPYQYIYNVYMRRLELVMSKYKGPIYEVDPNKIPDSWEMDKWMYYADILGWAVIDNFNEGKRGASTGKLAGSVNNTTGKVLDPQVGNYIQQIILMLQYIEGQMGEIAGVTKQRQGQVENRETVGGVERAVTQSSHITEKWFFQHDETKRRVLHALLDTAKYIWKKTDSKKLNYVLDDMSRVFLEFNPTDLASTEFDLFVSNSRKDMELKSIMNQLAQAGIQNGLGMSPVIRALREDSITAMARILDEAEEQAHQRASETAKQQAEAEAAKQQQEIEKTDKELEFKYYEADLNAQLEREKIDSQQVQNIDTGNNSLDQEKINIQKEKQILDERKHQNDVKLKERAQRETERSNRAKEAIQRNKPKTSSK